MYRKPQTEAVRIEMPSTLCSSQTVGFGSGKGTGAALAPARPVDYQHTNIK